MITVLNLFIEAQPDGSLSVREVDNAAYLDLTTQVGMIRRTWQLPQHDVRYAAMIHLDRRIVKRAVSDYLNALIGTGRVG